MTDESLHVKLDNIETGMVHIRWYVEHAMKAYRTEGFTSDNLVFKGPDALAYKCGAMSVNIESALSVLSFMEKELKEV